MVYPENGLDVFIEEGSDCGEAGGAAADDDGAVVVLRGWGGIADDSLNGPLLLCVDAESTEARMV